MKEEFNFNEELKPHIITEQDMRDEFSKGSIEMSFTGEWVPLEVVEGKFKEFISKLKESIKPFAIDINLTSSSSSLNMQQINDIELFKEEIIDKLSGLKSSKDNQKEVKKNMAYEEVGNPSVWTYQNDGYFIEGILVSKQDQVGANKSWIYTIETPEGVKSVWGSAILDSVMISVKTGVQIKITYKGLGEAKGGKNPPKIFKVEVDKEVAQQEAVEPEVSIVKPGA